MDGQASDPVWDFLVQMYNAPWENCPVHELAKGSTDLLGSCAVAHGPWPADSCAAVQHLWFGRGWTGLYYPHLPESWNLTTAPWRERTADDGKLAMHDAEELLNHPSVGSSAPTTAMSNFSSPTTATPSHGSTGTRPPSHWRPRSA